MMNSVFPDLTPKVIQTDYNTGFNRDARRKGFFVMKNLSNGKFIKRYVNKKSKKVIYKDVDIQEASVFKWKHIKFIFNEIPNVHMEPKLIRKINKQIVVIDGSKRG